MGWVGEGRGDRDNPTRCYVCYDGGRFVRKTAEEIVSDKYSLSMMAALSWESAIMVSLPGIKHKVRSRVFLRISVLMLSAAYSSSWLLPPWSGLSIEKVKGVENMWNSNGHQKNLEIFLENMRLFSFVYGNSLPTMYELINYS